jgi:ribosomal protein L14E/L6E/L27E
LEGQYSKYLGGGLGFGFARFVAEEREAATYKAPGMQKEEAFPSLSELVVIVDVID